MNYDERNSAHVNNECDKLWSISGKKYHGRELINPQEEVIHHSRPRLAILANMSRLEYIIRPYVKFGPQGFGKITTYISGHVSYMIYCCIIMGYRYLSLRLSLFWWRTSPLRCVKSLQCHFCPDMLHNVLHSFSTCLPLFPSWFMHRARQCH